MERGGAKRSMVLRFDPPEAGIMSDYLKTPEAAKYTCISVPTLERKRLVGDGPPFVKAGKSDIYRRADLDEWLASRIVRSTSEGV